MYTHPGKDNRRRPDDQGGIKLKVPVLTLIVVGSFSIVQTDLRNKTVPWLLSSSEPLESCLPFEVLHSPPFLTSFYTDIGGNALEGGASDLLRQ